MSKISVIIADDHQLFRSGLETLLRTNFSFEVHTGVENRKDLLAALAVLQIDIVLLDISLPSDSGLDILSDIHFKFPEVKCIMLTMHEEIQYVKESLKKGAFGYLLKDSAEKELFEAIEHVYMGRKHFKNKISDLLVEDMTSPKENQILSEREREIVRMVADGKITKEIAEKLFISVRTVETHRSNIMKKLGTSNASEMIRAAINKQLI